MKKGKITILASLIATMLVAVAVGAGTMAYFSDTKTIKNNVFTAGTLRLANEPNHQWTLSGMKPGDITTNTLTVKNVGSLDGYLYGRMTYAVTNGEDLGEVLMVTEWVEGGVAHPLNPAPTLNAFSAQQGTANIEGKNVFYMPYGLLDHGEEYTFGITVEWIENSLVDNDYQAAKLDFTIELLLHQESY